MIIPTSSPPAQPSPRVQELGQRIALTIAEYQQRNPDLSAEEVRAAAQLATSRVDAPHAAPARAVAVLVAGLAAAGLGVWLAGPSGAGRPPWVAIGALVVVVVAVFAVVRSRT